MQFLDLKKNPSMKNSGLSGKRFTGKVSKVVVSTQFHDVTDAKIW